MRPRTASLVTSGVPPLALPVATMAIAVGLFLQVVAAPAAAQTFAYFTNLDSGNLSVFDTSTNVFVTNIRLCDDEKGCYPRSITIAPSGAFAYVLAGRKLFVVDTITNTATGSILVGGTHVAFTPDGALAYLAGCAVSTVCVINTSSRSITALIPVEAAAGIAISPDGRSVYVAGTKLTVLDTATNTSRALIEAGGSAVALTPDARFAYVTQSGDPVTSPGRVAVIDTERLAVIATIPVGAGPADVAFTPDGRFAYVANHFSNVPFQGDASSTVSVIDTSTNTVATTIPLGDTGQPQGLASTPDGSRVYVANPHNNTFSVIDTATHAVIFSSSVGDIPTDVAIARVPSSPVPTPTPRNCNGDANRDGQVTIDEILDVVGHALNGCPAP